MQLKGENATEECCGAVIDELRHEPTVDAVRDVVGFGDKHHSIPVTDIDELFQIPTICKTLRMRYIFRIPCRLFATATHGSAAAGNTGLVIDRAINVTACIHVGLIAADPKRVFVENPRAKLDSRIAGRKIKFVLEVQFEVSQLEAAEDKKGLFRAFFALATSDDAVLGAPVAGQAPPAGEIISARDCDESILAGLGDHFSGVNGGGERILGLRFEGDDSDRCKRNDKKAAERWRPS